VGGEIYRTSPDWPWGPPSLLYNGYRVFPGGKERPGRDADPSPPSSAVVKKGLSYTSTPPMGCKACTEPQCLYKGALYLYLLLHTTAKLQTTQVHNAFPPYNIIFPPTPRLWKVHICDQLCRAIQKDVSTLKLTFTVGSIESNFLGVLQVLDASRSIHADSHCVSSQNFASMSV